MKRAYTQTSKNIVTAIVLCVCVMISCKQGDGISLGYVENEIGMNVVDTFTVQASTFLLDPLPTAGQGTILVGSLVDDDLGTLKSSSYFRLSSSELSLGNLSTDVTYDSLSLRLFYSGYAYGDTTKSMRIGLHRVVEDIELTELSTALEDDEYPVFVSSATIWADQQFAYAEEPLGSIWFSPRPNTVTDTVEIKLNDQLGRTLFDMAVNNDTRLTSGDEFVDFFKGLVLVPDEKESGAVIGFRDSLSFDVHYSYERQSDGMRVSDILRFVIGPSTHQYNHVAVNRTGTPLTTLSYDNNELPSSVTGHRTFIQGASGVVIRLRFPTAQMFVNDGLIAVSKAQLVIETDQSADSPYPPPASLVLMVANQYGTPTALLPFSYQEGTQQTATFQSAGQSGGTGYGRYVFDMTEYVSEMRKTTFNETESLLLSIPTTELMSSVGRLQIAANGERPAIKLNVMYVKI